jgi:hypothetical protein
MNPEFADEEPLNPFDMWKGANFKLKIRNVEGYRNYDKSEFASPSAISDDDSELEKIWKNEYSLKEFLDSKNFKSFDQIKARLDKVLGLTDHVPMKTRAEDAFEKVSEETSFDSGAVDDDLSYFNKLAEQN